MADGLKPELDENAKSEMAQQQAQAKARADGEKKRQAKEDKKKAKEMQYTVRSSLCHHLSCTRLCQSRWTACQSRWTAE